MVDGQRVVRMQKHVERGRPRRALSANNVADRLAIGCLLKFRFLVVDPSI